MLTRRARRVGVAVTVAALMTAMLPANAAPGDLDPTFSSDGKVTTSFPSGLAFGGPLVRQPDGRIVVGGFAANGTDDADFALVRYLPDGSLDTSFGSGGRVLTDFHGLRDHLSALALQPDGKIVAAGSTQLDHSDTGGIVVRYNPDGSRDTTFGGSGQVAISATGGAGAAALAIQPDGKIVVGATVGLGPVNGDFLVGRLEPTGLVDLAFGLAFTDFNGQDDSLSDLVLQPDGKILVAGTSGTGADGRIALARYLPSGARDSAFGSNGHATADFPGGDDRANGVALLPNGKFVIAGSHGSGVSPGDFLLARFNGNGALDTTFGTAGRTTTDFFGLGDRASDLVVQPDGKLIAVGMTTASHTPTADNYDFAVARYLPSGGLDPTFGTGGKVNTDFAQADNASSALLAPDGKLVVAGSAGDDILPPRFEFAAVRYDTQIPPCATNTNSGTSVLQVSRLLAPLSLLNLGQSTQTATAAPAGCPGNTNSGTSLIQLDGALLPLNLLNLGQSIQSVSTP